jgi:hypothetical protein
MLDNKLSKIVIECYKKIMEHQPIWTKDINKV